LHPFDATGAQWVINKIMCVGSEFVDLTIMQIVCHYIWEEANDKSDSGKLTDKWLKNINKKGSRGSQLKSRL
jgi:hypothetical protein